MLLHIAEILKLYIQYFYCYKLFKKIKYSFNKMKNKNQP
jgi:hypothetical protein